MAWKVLWVTKIYFRHGRKFQYLMCNVFLIYKVNCRKWKILLSIECNLQVIKSTCNTVIKLQFIKDVETFKFDFYFDNFCDQCLQQLWSRSWTGQTIGNLSKDLQEVQRWPNIRIPRWGIRIILIIFRFFLVATSLQHSYVYHSL